jgi:hypothetical protein
VLLLEIRLKLILLSRSFQCVTFACDHVMVGCPYLKYSQLRRWANVDGRLGGRGRICLPVGAKPTMGVVGGFDNLAPKFSHVLDESTVEWYKILTEGKKHVGCVR